MTLLRVWVSAGSRNWVATSELDYLENEDIEALLEIEVRKGKVLQDQDMEIKVLEDFRKKHFGIEGTLARGLQMIFRLIPQQVFF